jgi:hypothetical protein
MISHFVTKLARMSSGSSAVFPWGRELTSEFIPVEANLEAFN